MQADWILFAMAQRPKGRGKTVLGTKTVYRRIVAPHMEGGGLFTESELGR